MKPTLTKQAEHELHSHSRKINDLHTDIEAADGLTRTNYAEGVKLRIECGQLLMQSHNRCPKGEWEWWLKNNTRLSKSTAERWMRLARDPSRVTDATSLREALATISGGENGEKGQKEERSLVPYLQALDRVSKLCGFIERNKPKDAQEMLGWIPEEGKQKLREDLEPVVRELWPGRIG
jgi:hypothetical protein